MMYELVCSTMYRYSVAAVLSVSIEHKALVERSLPERSSDTNSLEFPTLINLLTVFSVDARIFIATK